MTTKNITYYERKDKGLSMIRDAVKKCISSGEPINVKNLSFDIETETSLGENFVKRRLFGWVDKGALKEENGVLYPTILPPQND